MKKIISVLILTALLLSSILAIIPVAAEEEATEKVNVLATSKDDQMNGVGPAFYYNYPLFNHDIGKYPINKVPQEDGSTKGYQGNTTYMLRAFNAANGGAASIDGSFETYADTYHTFNPEGKDVIDSKGDTYHFDSYLGVSLKETKTVDSFTFYTVNESTAGSKTLIEELTLFGARVNPETHSFDTWFKMTDAITDVQTKSSEDGRFAVVTGNFYMPFDVDYIFMAFQCKGESGGDYIVVELEVYEYAGGVDENLDLAALNEAIAFAEAELAKEGTYTTNSYNILNKAYEEAKAALTATNQMAVDYAVSNLYDAIAVLTPRGDTTALEAELAKYVDAVEAEYTTSSWAAFVAARDAASALITEGNASDASAAEHLAALTAAGTGLGKKASAEDLAALKARHEEAAALDNKAYTAQTMSALQVAMRNAKALTKEEVKDDVSVDQCADAMKALNDAFAGLKEKADMSALQAILDDVLSISADKYTAASFADLAAAITAAQQFLSGNANNATAEEATALGDAITAAKAALVALADFTALDAKIAEVEALNEADYSAETWKALKDAVAAAKALKDTEATQKQADDALAAIEAAAKALAAPATEPATEEPANNEGGCGGVIGATAVVITAVLGLGAVALRRKDN
jgi:hypothetical protein